MAEATRTALVTGAAGGIGLATVARLAAAGMHVVAVDARPEGLDALVERISPAAGLAPFRADVTRPDEVAGAVAFARETFGRVDVLVNVAGGSGAVRVRDVDAIDLETWDHVVALNLRSVFLMCRAVVPLMRAQRYGRIVSFSSVLAAGETGPITTVAGRLPYATAKAALIGFTKQLAKDLAEDGITVNVLVPGLVLGEPGTRIRDRFDALPAAARAGMLARYPMGRAGTAGEVAAAVEFLVCEAAGYVSGAAVPIDGAYG